MKYLRYSDDEDGWAKVVTVTREEAISNQRESYRRWLELNNVPLEPWTDEELIQGFIDVNDAYWVDDEDKDHK